MLLTPKALNSGQSYEFQENTMQVSDNKLLATYSVSHYLFHCPANVFTALIMLILLYFDLELVQFGLAASVITLAEGLCAPLGGALADRFNKRIFPPLSMVAVGSATLLIGILGRLSIYLFISCLLILSFSSALYHPSALSVISDRFQRGGSKAFGMFSLGGQAGFGTGPLTVAILLWLGGGILKNPFLAYSLWSIPIIGMGIILTVIHVKDPTIGASTTTSSPLPEVKSTTRPSPSATKVLLLPTFLFLLLATSARGFGRNLFEPYIVYFLVEVRQITEATAAFYLSLLILIGLPGTILGGIAGDRYGEKPVIISAYAVAALGLMFLLALQNPVWLPLVFLLIAFGQNSAMPNMNSWIAKIVPLNARGKAYGLKFFFPIALGSIAPTIAALIIQTFDFTVIFLIAISLYLFGALLLSIVQGTSQSEPVPVSTAK